MCSIESTKILDYILNNWNFFKSFNDYYQINKLFNHFLRLRCNLFSSLYLVQLLRKLLILTSRNLDSFDHYDDNLD